MGAIGAHFSEAELRCPCCQINGASVALVNALEALRERIGKPIQVTSAFRCADHNREVGGEPNSQHVRGWAADVKVEGMTPVDVYREAREIPIFKGFGVAKTFTHLDIRVSPARWCYDENGKYCAWNLGDE